MPETAKRIPPKVTFQLPAQPVVGGSGVPDRDATFRREMTNASKRILETVWEYTRYQSQAVFSYIDFNRHMIESFVVMNGYLIPPLSLHEVPELAFPDDEAGRNKFIEDFVDRVYDFEMSFMNHRHLCPRRVMLGAIATDQGISQNSLFEYGQGEPVEFADGLAKFQSEVLYGTWPTPLFSIVPISVFQE